MQYAAYCEQCGTLWLDVEAPGFVCVHDKVETTGRSIGPEMLESTSRLIRNRKRIDCMLVTKVRRLHETRGDR